MSYFNKRILIFHSNIPENAPKDELDVLDEVEFFNKILSKNNNVHISPFYNDLDKDIEIIKKFNPDLIVNLVETINGDGRLIHIAPTLFDYLGIPYTGCSSDAIYLTSNKILSKEFMSGKKINTAKFITLENIEEIEISTDEKFLIKSVWEHASVGIDEHKLNLPNSKNEIKSILNNYIKENRLFFAEKYIDGREFNISLIAGKVMPYAEIKFLNFPENKPKIVGYRAKWDEESFEYKNTVRSFDFKKEDEDLLIKLENLCVDCWKKFKLRGYARVDFRVDKNNEPYVLEINANPCISADSGFVAACNKFGMSDDEIVNVIIKDTLKC